MTSFLFNLSEAMHDILYCTLWTTPRTQHGFQPGKISVFAAWRRDKVTGEPTTWLLMKWSSVPRACPVSILKPFYHRKHFASSIKPDIE